MIQPLSTPCVVIDGDIMDANIHATQKVFDDLGVAFRPHIKTHKIPAIAQKQLDAGAIGINCQKISEAYPFVEAGFKDILLTYNIVGADKVNALYALSQLCDLKITADSMGCVSDIAAVFQAHNATQKILIECDTTGGRCGVQTPEQALELAKYIKKTDGVTLYGLMTYPAPDTEDTVLKFLATAKRLIEQQGMSLPIITTGGTPSLKSAYKYTHTHTPVITEYRAGTYVYADRSLVTYGTYDFKQCALTVQTTVVSVPHKNRCIIDAGSKALSSDLLNQTDYGYIKQYPNAIISGLSEEHGTVDISKCPQKPKLGDIVNIIPNHCCVVSNLFDTVYIVQNNTITPYCVSARGCVT